MFITKLFFCLILLSGSRNVRGSISPLLTEQTQQNQELFSFKPTKLFVFGDSYADTGNTPVSISASWRFPYGITFPGKPTGRFTDGRVSTDYLANYLGLRTPVAYRWRKNAGTLLLKQGMNFAFGGAGVFNTIFKVPNATAQIDYFQDLIHQNLYTAADLSSSVAYFSIVGNDYLSYNKLNGTQQDRSAFIAKVVTQILSDVERIKKLGVRKVLVAMSPPQACSPLTTTTKTCDINDANTALHNTLLRDGLTKLNLHDNKSFLMFDLYKAFVTVFKNKGVPGVSSFSDPLKTCCVGTQAGKACGDKGVKGEKLFNLCPNPKSFFFWDDVHLTQQGWRSVFSVLQPDLQF